MQAWPSRWNEPRMGFKNLYSRLTHPAGRHPIREMPGVGNGPNEKNQDSQKATRFSRNFEILALSDKFESEVPRT